MRLGCVSCSLLLALAVPAAAQVPDGWIIASTFRNSRIQGSGGIWIVDPWNGTKSPITNLPPEVTGTRWPASTLAGSDFVLRRPSDGAILTNGWGPQQAKLSFFVLRLSGTRVVRTDRYDLGTVTNWRGLGTPQACLLQNRRVLVAVDSLNLGVP